MVPAPAIDQRGSQSFHASRLLRSGRTNTLGGRAATNMDRRTVFPVTFGGAGTTWKVGPQRSGDVFRSPSPTRRISSAGAMADAQTTDALSILVHPKHDKSAVGITLGRIRSGLDRLLPCMGRKLPEEAPLEAGASTEKYAADISSVTWMLGAAGRIIAARARTADHMKLSQQLLRRYRGAI